MRILVLNQYFHPDRSATAQLLTELCEDLARDHDVTVVAGRPSYDPAEASGARGLVQGEWHGRVRVLRTWSTSFGRASMPGRLSNYASYLASSAAGAARAVRPDVVFAMTDPPLVPMVAAAVARTRGVPFVHTVQDLFPEVGVALGRVRGKAAVASLTRAARWVRESAAAVVAVGRDMRERLAGLGVPETKLHVIPNWADGRLIGPIDGPSRLRLGLGLGEAFVVMHAGNVGLSQSLGTLVEAARLLRGREDVRFVVVGNGAGRVALERRAAGLGNVQFLDYLPRAELADTLGTADAHVVGLRRGLAGAIVPSKLYGVMAAGRPFLAAVESNAEPALVAREEQCGIRVEPDDPRALATAIESLAARREEGAAMGRRGRIAFERRFDRPRATGAYRALLESVAGRASAAGASGP